MAVYLTRLATQLGIITIWIDTEGTSDSRRMEELGVDVSKLFSIQAGEGRLKNVTELSIETVGAELEYFIKTFNEKIPHIPILFIWDSLAQTRAKEEVEGGLDHKRIGTRASATQKMMNNTVPLLTDTNTSLIIVNQARDNLNMSNPYDDPIKSTGGKAFEHVASLRLKITKGATVKQLNEFTGKEDYHGHVMRVETKKSKLSRPGQKAEAKLLSGFQLANGEELNGLDNEFIIYEEAVERGLISKGAWRNYVNLNGEEIKLRDKEWVPRLKEDRELYLELFSRCYQENFPKGFAPFKNKIVDVTEIEEFRRLFNDLNSEGEKTEETE